MSGTPSIAADVWNELRPTTLRELPELARRAGVGRVLIKDESERPLGNFKVLGGMRAALRALARTSGAAQLLCASDGNHGLAVAAAARRAGTSASIYLPASVSEVRVRRIQAMGARIVQRDGTYDDAVEAAAAAAARGEGLLIADTSSDPNDPGVQDVQAGYAILARELVDAFDRDPAARPSHLYVQAGVGGLAAALADGFRNQMRAPGLLVIVEPESAACVALALERGRPVRVWGALHTSAEMLACGVASAPALEILKKHPVHSVLVSDEHLDAAVAALIQSAGPQTTASGAAGLAGFLRAAQDKHLRVQHGLAADSSVLLIITEGPASQG